MDVWHFWIVAGVVLLAAEMFTLSFGLASLGIGCLGIGLASYLSIGPPGQIIIFAALTLGSFFGIRPFFNKFLIQSGDARSSGVEALIGKTGTVTESINNENNQGRVDLEGEYWRARSEYGIEILTNETVKVERIEGATIYVIKLY